MKYKPYEFKPEDAYAFADFMHTKTKVSGSELHFYKCPKCGSPNKLDRWSFGIDLKTGMCSCFRSTCGYHGNMITLSQDFGFSLGTEVDEYFTPQKKYRSFPTPKNPIIPKSEAVKYLESRGISESTAKRYEITVQEKRSNILVFPFYDENGQMVYIKYRKTDFDKSKDVNKEWCEKGGKPILFGMKQCNPDNKTLIICEGQLDSLSVIEAGYENAISVPNGVQGFTWIPYCWDWMQNFDTFIVFGDHEKGHITLLEDIKRRFKKRIKHVRPEDYKDCKDANDILRKYGKEQIKICIENAMDEPLNHVKHILQIERKNPFAIPKVSTGIRELDILLYGGLPFGYTVLVSGKTGEGKSVFASQLLLNAIESGHKCFAYSGELPDWAFLSIIEYQAAGQHVFATKDRFGNERYDISETNARLIDAWLDKSLLIYDDSLAENSNEFEKLTDTVETVIQREGVDVILLDNLMTAMELDSTSNLSLNEKQTAFMQTLARIAKNRQVLIILVAHLRKNNTNVNGNDEVAGSSNIPNLAGINLKYESDRDIEPTQRKLRVWKERSFGRKNIEGFVLDYDEKTRRIYGHGDDVNKEYSWCPPDQFDDAIPDEIPF